jgi:hypothetical protein
LGQAPNNSFVVAAYISINNSGLLPNLSGFWQAPGNPSGSLALSGSTVNYLNTNSTVSIVVYHGYPITLTIDQATVWISRVAL